MLILRSIFGYKSFIKYILLIRDTRTYFNLIYMKIYIIIFIYLELFELLLIPLIGTRAS